VGVHRAAEALEVGADGPTRDLQHVEVRRAEERYRPPGAPPVVGLDDAEVRGEVAPEIRVPGGQVAGARRGILVTHAVAISRATLRTIRQNLGWAIGDNSLALPVAAGIVELFGVTLRPEIAAISMSDSGVLVALNAPALKRLRLP
jgi:hypothetical protein